MVHVTKLVSVRYYYPYFNINAKVCLLPTYEWFDVIRIKCSRPIIIYLSIVICLPVLAAASVPSSSTMIKAFWIASDTNSFSFDFNILISALFSSNIVLIPN